MTIYQRAPIRRVEGHGYWCEVNWVTSVVKERRWDAYARAFIDVHGEPDCTCQPLDVPNWSNRAHETLRFTCKKCGAQLAQFCTYTVDVTKQKGRTPTSRAMLNRYGRPTLQPHDERFRALDRAEERKTRKFATSYRPAPPDVVEAAHYMRVFNMIEHNALRAWLLEYGEVLTSVETPANPVRK